VPDDPVARAPAAYDWSRVLARAPEGLSVSAIVVSYRTGPVLMDCLHALDTDPDVHEIVLVDNGNTPETLSRIEALGAVSQKLKVIGKGQNRGFAAGVNMGVYASQGDRLLIINPDAVLRRGSIAALEIAHASGAEPVIAGGCIFGVDGVEQRGCRRRRLTMASAMATFLGLGWLHALHPGFVSINRNLEAPPAGPTPMGAVSGALMYMSRDGFARLNGFDEGYFLHVEDLDLCRRAEADGGSVIYTPFAAALHEGATSDEPSRVVEGHKAAGLSRYFRKFAYSRGERVMASLVGPAISAALILRAQLRNAR
jgi:N-acetylglucosaminyl-diphospho-decaprenol L-rhamnosyltransferase